MTYDIIKGDDTTVYAPYIAGYELTSPSSSVAFTGLTADQTVVFRYKQYQPVVITQPPVVIEQPPVVVNPTMVTLTFNANGGSDAPRPITVTMGTVMYFIGMSATPPNDTMVFVGWSTAQTGGNLITEILMNRGMTVYAQYEEIQKPKADPTPTATVAPTAPPTATVAPAPTTPSTVAPTQTVAPRPTDPMRVVPVDEAKWAAVNPLISVIGVIIAVIAAVWVLLLSRHNNNNKQNASNAGTKGSLQRWVIWLIAAVVLSVVSILVFFLTQDLSLPFGWIADKWAILHAALLAVEIIAIYACIQNKKRIHTKTAKNAFISNNNSI